MPYRPFRETPVASDAEVQAMLARLKRRIGDKVTVNGGSRVDECPGSSLTSPDGAKPSLTPSTNPSGAAQSPKEKSVLEWEKPVAGATGVKTKCGRYSCSKVTVNGKVNYELWRLVPGGGWFAPLNQRLDNFMQAQVLAQQDLENRA